MRIALVHRRFTTQGGTERYLVSLTDYLTRAGHEVHVFCNEVRKDLKRALPAVRFHHLPMLKLGGFMKVLSLSLSAYLLVPRKGFDVVQGFGRTLVQDVLRAGGGCHQAYYDSLLEEAKGLRRLFLRLSPRHRFTLWVERFQYRLPHYRRIIAVSRRVREELVHRLNVDSNRVEVVYNGVDLDRFHPDNRARFHRPVREACGLSDGARVVLFLGTGYRRKGLHVALQAFARAASTDARMMVVGGDASEREYRRLARSLGIVDRVVFCGATSEPERYYAASDLFVFPTRYEPFGNVCVEAMAAGLPVITTAVNGATEVFPEEARGLVVEDPDDVEGFAARMKALLSDPAKAARLGAVSRRAAEALTVKANGQRVEAIYRAVMKEKEA
jgi:UDP-glucose:(heptosyl)LPS alpha-1,3-glucosyltransferase